MTLSTIPSLLEFCHWESISVESPGIWISLVLCASSFEFWHLFGIRALEFEPGRGSRSWDGGGKRFSYY